MENCSTPKKGIIVFLDFLGWKGIWLGNYKKQPTEATFNYDSLDKLENLINKIEARFTEKTGKSKECFISISDTIALFIDCDESDYYENLKICADVCGEILDLAALDGFALRGAITVGEYATLKNIMVGPGVGECASWYEQANWLGVIFAPSAQFEIDKEYDKKIKEKKIKEKKIKEKIVWQEECLVRYDSIPLKGGFKGLKYCVKWGENPKILNEVLKNTISLPIDVAQKYINTQDYLYELRSDPNEDGGNANDDK